MIKLILMGDPEAKRRPRCMCLHGHGHTYDDQKKEMERLRKYILAAWNGFFDNPSTEVCRQAQDMALVSHFEVNLYFYMPLSRSWPTGQKNAKLWGLYPCSEKPDFDNMAKMYTDCATGIIWKDDKAITKCIAWKVRYSENPRTEMEIMSKKDLTLDEKLRAVYKAFSPTEMTTFCKEAGRIFKQYESNKQFFEDSRELPTESFLSETALHVMEFAKSYAPVLKKLASIYEAPECK